MNYQELIQIRDIYNTTNQETIKDNIKRLMKDNNIKHDQLVKLLEISLHTSYSYTNKANKNKPELYNLMIIAAYTNTSIYDIFQ